MDAGNFDRPTPRWVHVWAILTVIATVPLLALGGLVTTRQVGMADPVWPTTPWYILFASWTEPRPGFLIEHVHRFAGWIVGVLVVVLAVGMWRTARRRSLRWLGLACLVGVSIQGLLGGFRVALHDLLGPNLAAVHGCFAQIVFCLFVSAAYLTRKPDPSDSCDDAARCARVAVVLIVCVFVQLIFGALLRHTPRTIVQRLHFITAFAVVAVAVVLLRSVRETGGSRLASRLLMVFLAVQILLGVEAWMGKFASPLPPDLQPPPTTGQIAIRTGHVLVGTGIFASAVVIFLQSRSRAPALRGGMA